MRMKKMITRVAMPLAIATGAMFAVAGVAAAYPGTDAGIDLPEPPIYIDPDGGPELGIFPPPEPPVVIRP